MVYLQEQLFYISVVTELFNLFSFVFIFLNIQLDRGFGLGLGIYNGIYFGYMIFIILITRGKFRECGFIILVLSCLKGLIWKDMIIVNVLDSLICLGVLFYYHRYLFAILNEIRKAKGKREENA